jgi:hypothetical protein
LQYDAYDDVENLRSVLNCLILKRYKLQKAAANRSGFFVLRSHFRESGSPNKNKLKIDSRLCGNDKK